LVNLHEWKINFNIKYWILKRSKDFIFPLEKKNIDFYKKLKFPATSFFSRRGSIYYHIIFKIFEKKVCSFLILPPFRKKYHSRKSWFATLLSNFEKKRIKVILFIVLHVFSASILLSLSFCWKWNKLKLFKVLEMWFGIFLKIWQKGQLNYDLLFFGNTWRVGKMVKKPSKLIWTEEKILKLKNHLVLRSK